MNNMKLISKKELRKLLANSELLSRLETLKNKDVGSMMKLVNEFDEWETNELDKILDRYMDYIEPEIENYNYD